MWERTDRKQPGDTLEQLSTLLERILTLLLAVAAACILAVAVMIIATMDAGSKSQGGRYFVAVGALVALGWVDRQLMRLVWRRFALIDGDWGRYRRVCIHSGLLLLVIGTFLIGLAYWLP